MEEGRVRINQKTASLGDNVAEGDEVYVDGEMVVPSLSKVLIAFNKPLGIVSTCGHYRGNIIDFIDYPERIYPIGRLDKDSSGLILLTNQGDFANALTRTQNHVEKEYEVEVDRDITKDFLDRMREGIYLGELDKTTIPCEVHAISKRRFNIILTQGLNRQIRRMCRELGYRVLSLRRTRIGRYDIGDIREGQWRKIDASDVWDTGDP